tara:strand:+ start:1075 stop:1251 length:177 start_codon:yes stop_codon:yes gene_type:complete
MTLKGNGTTTCLISGRALDEGLPLVRFCVKVGGDSVEGWALACEVMGWPDVAFEAEAG